jgi:predicted nucleotidyltransferase
MPESLQAILDKVVTSLNKSLGDNLYSCALYGSAVRGNYVENSSDLNLLIIVNDSNPSAHQLIAGVLGDDEHIDPFILSRRGFERSVRAFLPKFASIQRNYRLLAGIDPFAGTTPDPQLERFLCEQALRNLRLRMVYAFVTRSRRQGYGRFLAQAATPFVVHLAEVLRLDGIAVPKDYQARIPVFEKEMGVDGRVLTDLLAFKQSPRKLSNEEMVAWHERVFPLVDRVLIWLESRWPA